jgi:transcriptional regulator with XRE-family HTH domain
MKKGRHWTDRSVDDFVHGITFDFATQIAKALEGGGVSQVDLAKELGVSEGRVSQILNSPGNLGLKSVVKCARAIGRKVAIVLYDDGDSTNRNGPINSEVFSTCWERAGRPVDFFALRTATTSGFLQTTHAAISSTNTYSHASSGYNASFKPPLLMPGMKSE